MKAAATHKGSCQRCGSVQKLPNGYLSLHGYTKRWGFFNGICPGSRRLPYEQSCEDCKAAVIWAKDEMNRLKAEIAALELPAETAWVHDYVNGHGVWRQVTLSRQLACESQGRQFYYFYFTSARGSREHLHRGSAPTERSIEQEILACNRQYAFYQLAPRLRELQAYQKWQQERVDAWKPKELAKA
jgi:hypothetical protein